MNKLILIALLAFVATTSFAQVPYAPCSVVFYTTDPMLDGQMAYVEEYYGGNYREWITLKYVPRGYVMYKEEGHVYNTPGNTVFYVSWFDLGTGQDFTRRYEISEMRRGTWRGIDVGEYYNPYDYPSFPYYPYTPTR